MCLSFVRRVAAVLFMGIGLGACVSSQPVELPGGSTGYDVSCFNGRWACSNEATRVCNGGKYVVLDDDATVSWLSNSRQGSMRIQCADDYVADQAPAPAPAAPVVPGATPSAVAVCRGAYKTVVRLAEGWSQIRHAPIAPMAPTSDDFLPACLSLPEPAQLCLHLRYSAAHKDACVATITGLVESDKAKLDALLLAHPPATEKARPGVTPDTKL